MPNFSGKWTLTEQAQGIAAGTWPLLFQYELYSWGNGYFGKLGHGDTVFRSSPTQVTGGNNWDKIAANGFFSIAIKTDGTLWTWGRNAYGELGQNNTTFFSSPVQVGALTTWSQIGAGSNHTAAIKTDGTLWTWGNDGSGKLGLNQPDTDMSSPTQVGSLTTWSQVSAGTEHTAAIKTDGTLWTWGNDGSGRLGLNQPDTDRSSPVQVGALTSWLQVSAGINFTAAVKTDGTLWTWGAGSNGKLGHNNVINRSSPVQVGSLTTWAKVTAGNNASFAIKTDGTIWAWGSNTNGQLGTNENQSLLRSSPVQIGSLTDWSAVFNGQSSNVIATKTDGTLWVWGVNTAGVLGLNDKDIHRSSPVQLGADTNWVSAAAGGVFMLAITKK